MDLRSYGDKKDTTFVVTHGTGRGVSCWPQRRTFLRQADGFSLNWRDMQFTSSQPSVVTFIGKGGKFRVVPTHPLLVGSFHSVPQRRANQKVFAGSNSIPLSARTAVPWIADGIAQAGLQAACNGASAKGPPATAYAIAAPSIGYSLA